MTTYWLHIILGLCPSPTREFTSRQTYDGNGRAVGILNHMYDKNEGRYQGKEGRTRLTTACPESDASRSHHVGTVCIMK